MSKRMIVLCLMFALLTGCGSGESRSAKDTSSDTVSSTSESSSADTDSSKADTTQVSEENYVVIYMDNKEHSGGKVFDDKELLDKVLELYSSIPTIYEPVKEKESKKGNYIRIGTTNEKQEQETFVSSNEKLYIPDKSDSYVRIDGKHYNADGGEIKELVDLVLKKTES